VNQAARSGASHPTRQSSLWAISALAITCFAITPPSLAADHSARIRVASLGDSITAGARVDAPSESYPARLQKLLGDTYTVQNFGIGGATLIKTGRASAPPARFVLAIGN